MQGQPSWPEEDDDDDAAAAAAASRRGVWLASRTNRFSAVLKTLPPGGSLPFNLLFDSSLEGRRHRIRPSSPAYSSAQAAHYHACCVSQALSVITVLLLLL